MDSASVFLSYSHQNRKLAEAVADAIERAGVRGLWWDRALSAGTRWRPEVEIQIKNAEIVLLLLTGASADAHNKSAGYMWTEEFRIANARMCAGERVRIVPILAENVGQFLELRPETRLLEFERLLRDDRYYTDGADEWLEEVAQEVADLAAVVRGANQPPPIEVDMRRRGDLRTAMGILQGCKPAVSSGRIARALDDARTLLDDVAVDRALHSIPCVLGTFRVLAYEWREQPEVKQGLLGVCEALDFWYLAHGDDNAPHEAERIRVDATKLSAETAEACGAQLDNLLRSVRELRAAAPAQDDIARAAVESASRQIAAHEHLARSQLLAPRADVGSVVQELDQADVAAGRLGARSNAFVEKSDWLDAPLAEVEAAIATSVRVVTTRSTKSQHVRRVETETEPEPEFEPELPTRWSEWQGDSFLKNLTTGRAKPRVVLVMGFSGAGKTRFVHEIRAAAPSLGYPLVAPGPDQRPLSPTFGVEVSLIERSRKDSMAFLDVDGEYVGAALASQFEDGSKLFDMLCAADGIFYCLSCSDLLASMKPGLYEDAQWREDRVAKFVNSLGTLSALLAEKKQRRGRPVLVSELPELARDDRKSSVPFNLILTHADDPLWVQFRNGLRAGYVGSQSAEGFMQSLQPDTTVSHIPSLLRRYFSRRRISFAAFGASENATTRDPLDNVDSAIQWMRRGIDRSKGLFGA